MRMRMMRMGGGEEKKSERFCVNKFGCFCVCEKELKKKGRKEKEGSRQKKNNNTEQHIFDCVRRRRRRRA